MRITIPVARRDMECDLCEGIIPCSEYYIRIQDRRAIARICAMCCGELHKYRLDHKWWLPATVKERKI